MDWRQRGNLMCPQSDYKLRRRGICSPACRVRGGGWGWGEKMTGRKVAECGSPRQPPLEVWPQMASFTTGPPKWSSHRVYGEIWGIWQETDMGEIEENIMVNWWGSSVLLSSQTALELAVTAPYVPYPELQQPSEEHLLGSQLLPIHLW